MKKLLYILLFSTITSCVNNDDFGIPIPKNADTIVIPSEKLTTFKAIHSRFDQAKANGQEVAIIRNDEDVYLEGYVISSDYAGNFFEELIIQNKIDNSDPDEDPRLGIRISINVGSLSETYDFGRKVYIKLAGLTIAEVNGVLSIGKGEDPRLEQIQEFEYRNIVIRTSEVFEIIPKVTTIQDLTNADQNTFIQLNNMQFNRFELGRTYAGESFDEFDGFRLLESCDSGASMFLQTSTFADFKSLTIPIGKGTITGILNRNFGDDFNVLAINTPADINFDNAERCDPLEISCGLASSFGTRRLFYENFESQRNNQPVAGSGWTNYIEAGSEAWEAYTSTSTNASLGRSARFQSSASGDISNIGWLITPAINLDVQEGETLRFKTSNSLADSSFMEVLISSNWDGNIANIKLATWAVLSDAYVVNDTDSFVPWFNSGNVNLSCLSGTVHIAFKYTGGGQENFDGVYELDEVSVDY